MIFQERRLGFLSGALINDLRRQGVYVTMADDKNGKDGQFTETERDR